MQKFIRIALPWVCIAVMVWYLFFDGSNYLDLKWLVGVAGIGVVCYIGLYVKLHKLQKQLQKQKEEHLCLLKK
jgi:membrane protein YdbS with pleckstrin-like domain